jgi:hypothetical protein
MFLTGRLESALESVLLADGYLREHLISRHGFSIHRVRYAKDRRTVHILWDAAPGQAEVSIQVLGLGYITVTEWPQRSTLNSYKLCTSCGMQHQDKQRYASTPTT